jgi:hypothetical protein
MQLGSIVHNIRRKGIFLNDDKPERTEWLDRMGFVWNDHERRWRIAKLALTIYKEIHGDLLVPQQFVVVPSALWAKETWGTKLGSIVNTIRDRGVYLSDDKPERREWLGNMGFVWIMAHDQTATGTHDQMTGTAKRHSRSFSRSFASVPMRRSLSTLPSSLPSSAFDQHYAGNSFSSANLSQKLLDTLCSTIGSQHHRAQSAYEVSMPMLSAALLGPACSNNTGSTSSAMAADLQRRLKKELDTGSVLPSFACWLDGRLLLANPELTDGGVGLLERLKGAAEEDQFIVWAWSYLLQHFARHDPTAYDKNREEWVQRVHRYAENRDHSSTDRGWALVCALSASADADDSESYTAFKQLAVATARSPAAITAMDALVDNVPAADFRAWAASLVSVSAARMGDWSLLGQDDDQFRETLLLECTDDNDRVLAIANFFFSDYCLWHARQQAADAAGADGSSRDAGWRVSVPTADAALRQLRAPLQGTE